MCKVGKEIVSHLLKLGQMLGKLVCWMGDKQSLAFAQTGTDNWYRMWVKNRV